MTTPSRSKHFSLHQLSGEVFVAIAEDGGAAICNAGLINLGGQVLIFDTFLTPQAAMDLRRNAEELFGQLPQVVINSHPHNDHIWGNQAFAPETNILSSNRTRELIIASGVEEVQYYAANSAQRLQSLRSQYENTQDEGERENLTMWLGYHEGLVEALPNLSIRLPNITFISHLELYGKKLAARLITFEGAHSASDTVLYLPQEGILFMGDLLFVGCNPYLADGDPLKLQKVLQELSRLDASQFIPGHGPVGTLTDLQLLSEYIDHSLEIAQKLVKEGGATEDRIAALAVDERFKHLKLPQFFYPNISFFCNYLSSTNN
jgi:glyoxylase-like metal-dependent hydrolase (beta-lactamase superfamily II)